MNNFIKVSHKHEDNILYCNKENIQAVVETKKGGCCIYHPNSKKKSLIVLNTFEELKHNLLDFVLVTLYPNNARALIDLKKVLTLSSCDNGTFLATDNIWLSNRARGFTAKETIAEIMCQVQAMEDKKEERYINDKIT